MKKQLIFAAVAALTLGSCAKVQTISNPEMDAPIGFSAYSGNPVTKAGTAGEMNATLLASGFGVFAYKTTGNYDGSTTPDFMYNQLVNKPSSSWEYTPIKYWPNQLAGTTPAPPADPVGGNTDSQGTPAQSYSTDKVSFFAYAPYVAATPSTGAVTPTTEGITALSKHDDTGDPLVTYTVTNDLTKQVDLVWGVSNGDTWNNVAGGTNTPTKFLPYLNLQKPAVGTDIHFYFHHALAQLKLQAIAAYNVATPAASPGAKNGVRITIESVALTVPGMYDEAVLNLNNDAVDNNGTPGDTSDDKAMPKWDVSGASTAPLNLTVSGSNINANLKDGGAGTTLSQPAGVIYKAGPYVTPFDEDVDVIVSGKYYTLIPKEASTTVSVTITYYVTTDDPKLAAGYSRVKNVISHDVTFTNGFKAGTRNIIRMILGISEVSFAAEVLDWETGVSQDVYLPQNLES